MKASYILEVLIVCLLITLVEGTVYAQAGEDHTEKGDMKTLFDPESRVTGYGALDTKFSMFNDDYAVFVGAQGGVIFDGHFYLGIGAYGLVTDYEFEGVSPQEKLSMEMGYSGIILAYNVAPKKVVHFSVPVLFGAGALEVNQKTEEYNSIFVENSTFLVIEPGLQIELNLVKFMKIGIGGTYRFIKGINMNNPVTNDDLSNFSGQFSLVFGSFI